MSSAPVKFTATSNGQAPGAIGRPGAAAGLAPGGATSGTAFLSLLDQMLGVSGGRTPPATTAAFPGSGVHPLWPDGTHPRNGSQPTGAPFPFDPAATGSATTGIATDGPETDSPVPDELTAIALRFANPFAGDPSAQGQEATTGSLPHFNPASADQETTAEGSPDDGTNGVPAAGTAANGFGAWVVQTDTAGLAADASAVAGERTPGSAAQAVSTQIGTSGATTQAIGDSATTPDPAGGAERAPAPATAGTAPNTAQTSTAGQGQDPDLETLLAAFGRPAGKPQPGQAQTASPALAQASPQTATTGAEAGQITQLSSGNRQYGQTAQGEGGTDRRIARASRETAGSDASAVKGKVEADPLARLLAAGPRAVPAPAANANTADTLTQTGGGLFGQTLVAINEVGDTTVLAQSGGQALSANAASASAGATATTARPDVNALAIRIAQKSQDGTQRFEIALDPPELGRVDVRLEFGRDGRVATHLTVDSTDTLDALMRDSRGLERALQAQGLKLDDGGVQYHLRDQSSFTQHEHGQDTQDHSPPAGTEADGTTQTSDPEEPAPTRRLTLGGLDVRI